MSAQTVLLPVFVLVGFTFVLLLMAGRRQGAVMAGETKNKDTALGQFELPLGWEMVYRHRVGVSDSLP